MSRLSPWIPAVLWAALIFNFSTDSFSSAKTAVYVITMLQWLLPNASEHTLNVLHQLIRKGGHVFEYFVFGLLLFRAFRASHAGSTRRWALETLIIAGLFAASDEFHQSFVPSRGPSALDALLDTSAAGLAVFAAWLLIQRYSASRASVAPPAS